MSRRDQPRTGDGKTSSGKRIKASDITNNLPSPGKRGAARATEGRSSRLRITGYVADLITGKHRKK